MVVQRPDKWHSFYIEMETVGEWLPELERKISPLTPVAGLTDLLQDSAEIQQRFSGIGSCEIHLVRYF